MRSVEIIHALPGRVRLRAPFLREDRALAGAVAEGLAEVPGVLEVRARPYTGSVLVLHDPAQLDAATIVVATARLADARALAVGERPPIADAPEMSRIARAAARFFQELDRDVRRASEGRVDLGTVATLGFLAAGAAEVVVTRKMPMPPWFNLAWWGFRTFMSLEQREIAASGDEVGGYRANR